jgi:cysteine synthase A
MNMLRVSSYIGSSIGISSIILLHTKQQKSSSCDIISNDALSGAIGNTPLLPIRSLSEATGCLIYAKAEFLNPSGSIKDRAAKAIIEEAEKSGKLKPGGTIVEGTGGNTGIALAQLGKAKGYNVVLCMPNCISEEKIETQRRYGAEVHLQPLVPYTNPENYARRAEILAKERGIVHTNQFENLANFRAHFKTTGPEIYKQTDGRITAFIAAAGTGGTLAGTSSFLKSADNNIKCYLIDPSGSALFNYVKDIKINNINSNDIVLSSSGNSQVEGIGISRITANFAAGIKDIDDAFHCTDQEAVEMAYYLLRNEGIFVGPSAALNVVGAVKAAKKLGKGNVIVTILCDSGDRYISKLYNKEWY